MKSNRSRQQVAFDGVRVAWHGDTFTEILSRQASDKFSMDGVVPQKHVTTRYHKVEQAPERSFGEAGIKHVQAQLGKVAQSVDGVRLPWRRAYASS